MSAKGPKKKNPILIRQRHSTPLSVLLVLYLFVESLEDTSSHGAQFVSSSVRVLSSLACDSKTKVDDAMWDPKLRFEHELDDAVKKILLTGRIHLSVHVRLLHSRRDCVPSDPTTPASLIIISRVTLFVSTY